MIGLGYAGAAGKSASTPVNLVLNPAFTTNITGWDSLGNSQRDTTVYRSAPASLNTYFDGENIPYALYSRSAILTAGQRYSVSIWLRTTTSNTFQITFSGGISSPIAVTGSTSWQNLKFENVLVSSTNLNLSIYSSLTLSDTFNIDDVSVVSGATALVL